jgi:NADP-dependent 3-hydroxy acid dehydrogenase YdfG
MASVLITGASKGIGRAAAAELARRGHRVIATARDPRTLAGLPADQRLALDVTNPGSITSAVGEAGEVDVLVSNAGEIFVAAVEATPPEALARLLDINTIGALRVAQAVLPGMRARGRGRLLFVSSIAGRIVPPREAAYAATKWALEALVEALAIEAGPLGIEAALLEPGPVSSGALDHVTTYTQPGDPYTHLPGRGGTPASQMTPEQVAAGIADAAEAPQLPLRIPIGRPAAQILAARRAAPDDRPFIPVHPRPPGRERQIEQSEGDS